MVKIYGWSDDLVEIEGSSYKAMEIDCFQKDVVITFLDGTVIRVGYSKPGVGVWYIIVEKQGPAVQRLDICEEEDEHGYSDTFYIDSDIESHYLEAQKGKEMLSNQGELPKQPEIIIYDKLVRDRIPEIIEASGDTCNTEVLSKAKYLEMLNAKLSEELDEYNKDHSIEELADLLEVIRAIVIARGYTLKELEDVRAKKAAERGVFKKRILLKTVTKGENND